MAKYGTMLAESAGQGALGGIFDLAFSGLKNDQQLAQQGRLNVLQREMMDYNNKLQYDLWQKTGPTGQMEQLKKAGLNPGLIYGMNGAGGATTGGGGGNNAPGAAGAASGMQAAMQMGQLGLLRAQKENIEADTASKKAGIPKTQAETAGILQGITNAQTQNKLMETENRLKLIEEKWKDLKEGNENAILEQDLNIRKEQLQIIENDATISEVTKGDKIKQIKAEAVQAVLRKAQIIADTKLSGAQAEAAKKSLAVMSEQINTLINNRYLGWAELQDKGIARYTGDEGEAIYNIPIIGGLIKEVDGFIQQKSKNPVGFKVGK